MAAQWTDERGPGRRDATELVVNGVAVEIVASAHHSSPSTIPDSKGFALVIQPFAAPRSQ
jgi:hypothetical protein